MNIYVVRRHKLAADRFQRSHGTPVFEDEYQVVCAFLDEQEATEKKDAFSSIKRFARSFKYSVGKIIIP